MLPVAVSRASTDDSTIRYLFLWMTSCFYIMERAGQNQRRHVCFVQFARWQHRGEVYRLDCILFKALNVDE